MAMLRRGVTVEQLATRVGRSTSYVSRIKNQQRRANLELLHNMANALRIDPAGLTQQDLRIPVKGSAVRQVVSEIRQWRQAAERWVQLLEEAEHELRPMLRIAEQNAEYSLPSDPSQKVPVLSPRRGRLLLNRLAKRGRLGEVAAGEPRLAFMVEVPEAALDSGEVDELYRSKEYTEHIS